MFSLLDHFLQTSAADVAIRISPLVMLCADSGCYDHLRLKNQLSKVSGLINGSKKLSFVAHDFNATNFNIDLCSI